MARTRQRVRGLHYEALVPLSGQRSCLGRPGRALSGRRRHQRATPGAQGTGAPRLQDGPGTFRDGPGGYFQPGGGGRRYVRSGRWHLRPGRPSGVLGLRRPRRCGQLPVLSVRAGRAALSTSRSALRVPSCKPPLQHLPCTSAEPGGNTPRTSACSPPAGGSS